MKIETTKILPNPMQPRTVFDEGEMEELAASLDRDGLLNAISVEKLPNGWYMLTDGERRWRAALSIGWREIEATVRESCADDTERLALALVANLQREDMGPADVARGYAQLRETMTVAEIAARMGRSEGHIYQMLSLLISGLTEHTQAVAGIDSLNGEGPAVTETCRRCGMADEGMLTVCRDCPLVTFLLVTAELAAKADA